MGLYVSFKECVIELTLLEANSGFSKGNDFDLSQFENLKVVSQGGNRLGTADGVTTTTSEFQKPTWPSVFCYYTVSLDGLGKQQTIKPHLKQKLVSKFKE